MQQGRRDIHQNAAPVYRFFPSSDPSNGSFQRKNRSRNGRRGGSRGVVVLEAPPPQGLGRKLPPQTFFLLPTRNDRLQWQTRESDRGVQENCDKIQINTDGRSRKIEDIKRCPFGEICWYFTDSWEQFRINGRIDIVDGSNPDPLKLQQREKVWFESSPKSRLQYLGPAPGLPVIGESPGTENQLDPSAGPVDAFCLLILDPEQVDYLNLKSSERLLFISRPSGSDCKIWMFQKTNP